MRYVKHNLIAVTQMLNALAGGFPDESTSSRAYRQQHKPHWRIIRVVIDAAFFWQADHCASAYRSERDRRQTHPDLR